MSASSHWQPEGPGPGSPGPDRHRDDRCRPTKKAALGPAALACRAAPFSQCPFKKLHPEHWRARRGLAVPVRDSALDPGLVFSWPRHAPWLSNRVIGERRCTVAHHRDRDVDYSRVARSSNTRMAVPRRQPGLSGLSCQGCDSHGLRFPLRHSQLAPCTCSCYAWARPRRSARFIRLLMSSLPRRQDMQTAAHRAPAAL